MRYFRASYNYEEHIGLANNARNLLIYLLMDINYPRSYVISKSHLNSDCVVEACLGDRLTSKKLFRIIN